jgi:hypothetical protein
VAEIARSIAQLERVQDLDVNPATGSILLHLRPDDPVDAILADIAELGYLVERLSDGPRRAPGRSGGRVPHSRISRTVSEILAAMNARVHEATNGRADLRFIVPAALTVLAVRQLLRDAKSLRDAPWYVLMYYAFDSFYKLNAELAAESPAQ